MATDIVVVTEGKKIDGIFRVVEVWKGDLHSGETIQVPELASFLPEKSRVVQDVFYEKPPDKTLIVSGDRMVLFLKRESNALSTSSADQLASTSIKWKPATFYDEFNVAVAWIEQGESYAFVQQLNPGPSQLMRLGVTEEELKRQVGDIRKTQTDLLSAAAISDRAQRAAALAPFARHPLYAAREQAFTELKKCGKAALPILRGLLADDSLLEIHASLVEVLSDAGRSDASPDLAALLERDLDFWKQTGPALQKGWWNGAGFESLKDVEPLRNRYSRDHEVLLALRKRPFQGAEEVLRAFRNFWASLPQLAEPGLDQMIEDSDRALKEIARLKGNKNEIRFEGLQTFDEDDLLAAVTGSNVLVDDPALLTQEVIDRIQTIIKEFLGSRGFTHPTITAEADTESRTLIFNIDEGKRVDVTQIRFEGNKVFSSDRLAAELKQCLTRNSRDGVDGYNSDAFEYCLRSLSNLAQSQGYLKARFNHTVTESEKGLIITVQAEEGVLYRLGNIQIERASVFPIERIRSMLTMKRGDVANGELLSEWLFEDLKKIYGESGYIQYTAEITPEFKSPENSPDGVVNLVVTIDEGKQFRIRKLSFAGATVPIKVQQALLVHEGDVYNQKLFEKTIEKLNESLSYLPIDKDKDVDYRTNDEEGLVDITINLSRKQG